MSLPVLKAANCAAFLVNLTLNKTYGKKIGKIAESNLFDHVGLPKGPAFAIWGLIYAWELVFVIGQAAGMCDSFLGRLTPWFCIGVLMQGTWVPMFTATEPAPGGDFWLYVSSAWLVATPVPFLLATAAVAHVPQGPAYWISYGVTVNAAWVVLAAGLTINTVARAAQLEGTAASAVAMIVLVGTVGLELWITGLVGSNPLNSPTAFFTVGVWALFWVFMNLKSIPDDTENEHGKRILPIYGSSFVTFYKWTAVALLVVFVILEVLVCRRKGQSEAAVATAATEMSHI